MFTPLAFKQPQLVTDGLVLYLDAADRTSYVSGSTVWRDLSAGNNGTLTNGPTFDTGMVVVSYLMGRMTILVQILTQL